MTGWIVIVASPDDVHALCVAREIRTQGIHPVLVVDTAGYPREWSLSLEFGSGGGSFTLKSGQWLLTEKDIGAVWWRRPNPLGLRHIDDPKLRDFCQAESWTLLRGWIANLGRRVVNPLLADQAADWKPTQLAAAPRVGLRIPPTLISSDPAAAENFFHEQEGRLIFKTLGGNTQQMMTETRVFRAADLEKLASLHAAPAIFQRNLGAGGDIRVAVVEDEAFASSIEARLPAGIVDWRLDTAVCYHPHELPTAVKKGCVDLVRRLGLYYGALDFKLIDGEYHFLEINPGGQFLFQDIHSGTAVVPAMARLLARLATTGSRHPADATVATRS